MPELPEVETLRRELERALVGRVFRSVKVSWPKTITPLTVTEFSRRLKNQKIESVERRAKILFLDLTNGESLAIHLKMTGQLIFQPGHGKIIGGGQPQSNPFQYTRVVFNFTDDSRLFFNDLRKFGWLRLLPAQDKKILAARHGIEPLSPKFNLKTLAAILQRYPERKLKQILLDQTLIAGLGNIYVDESCFAARLRPARRLKTLRLAEIEKLRRAIKKILRLAVAKGGTSARDYRRSDGSRGGFVPYLKVYGHGGQPCRKCGRPIKKIRLAGRGTHFCSRCQK